MLITLRFTMKKLNWKYALGELVVITLGVLLALGLDLWKQSLADDKLEVTYISRLKKHFIKKFIAIQKNFYLNASCFSFAIASISWNS